MLALAALLASYGAAELLGGYGFLAVFVCAMRLRASERSHSYQRAMHGLVERLERLMTLLVLLVLGHGDDAAACSSTSTGAASPSPWRSSSWCARSPATSRWACGPATRTPDGGLDRGEMVAVAFFGVRGVGSLYYLAYAVSHEHVPDEPWLWSTVAFTVIVSVLLHGVTATPAMARIDARRRPHARAQR